MSRAAICRLLSLAVFAARTAQRVRLPLPARCMPAPAVVLALLLVYTAGSSGLAHLPRKACSGALYLLPAFFSHLRASLRRLRNVRCGVWHSISSVAPRGAAWDEARCLLHLAWRGRRRAAYSSALQPGGVISVKKWASPWLVLRALASRAGCAGRTFASLVLYGRRRAAGAASST